MFKTKLRKRPRIEIIPMIDVIFFLLVFFMLFTTFKTTPHGLDIRLPQATTAAQQEDQNITIYISSGGRIFLDEEEKSIPDLAREIRQKQEIAPHLVAIINADQETPYNYVVRVMDVLRDGGIYRISFGAEPLRGD